MTEEPYISPSHEGSIFVVGAGPVATIMARELRIAGVVIAGLWSRDAHKAEAAAASAGVLFFAAPPAQMRSADVILLAVRDDAITSVAAELVHAGHVGAEAVLVHFSGAQSSQSAFAQVRPLVAGVGLLHPLRALASPETVDSLSGTFFAIEGDDKGRAVCERLCSALGGRAMRVASEHMASYHAAASIASNFVVVLLDLAHHLLRASGVDDEVGRQALCELATGAVKNVEKLGLPEALTGPIRRGDTKTIAAHLQALHSQLPEGLELYRQAAQRALVMANKIGEAESSQLEEIAAILAADPGWPG